MDKKIKINTMIDFDSENGKGSVLKSEVAAFMPSSSRDGSNYILLKSGDRIFMSDYNIKIFIKEYNKSCNQDKKD